MNKILIVGVNWLGDSLMTTPAFKALKEKFPSSYIGIMTVGRVRGVFDDSPYVDEVIVFNEKGEHKGLLAKVKFIIYLKKKKFDTVFLIHRSFTRALICFLAGIKLRVGYRRSKNTFVINKKINPVYSLIHRQDNYLHLFEASGIKISERLPQFFVPASAEEKMEETLKPLRDKYSYFIGINPSANWNLKRWPESYFASLADSLVKNLKAAIIFIGTNHQSSVIDGVRQRMEQKSFNFCGKTNLKELGALIKAMNLFISNDSGPAHLAAALGVNTLVIFGPTSPEATAPRGKAVKIIKAEIKCKIPCYKLDCQDNICLKELSVEKVYFQVKTMLTND